ncbi:MAG: alpha/beta hydrolase [Burkholderiaceae bacterium]|jgi:predicted esterase|nr:alpha/beta hydrolase [Burkholderiaceae bacterium]
MKPLVHFIHGKESGPWGTKIQYLAHIAQENGYDTESLHYTHLANPTERVALLCQSLSLRPATFLVGSSMGGWVALTASARIQVNGLFLLAPAVYVPDYPPHAVGCPGSAIHVVHGWHDSLIPCRSVIRFCEEHRCTLHLVDDEHRLKQRLEQVGDFFRSFLRTAGREPETMTA